MSGNQGDYGYTRDVIASGRRLLAEVDKRAPSGVRWMVRTASATRALPAQMQELIASELLGIVRTLTARGREALVAAEEAVDTAGSPTSLRELADLLDGAIAARASDLASFVRSDRLQATDEEAWTGKAAWAYRTAMEGQGEAVGRIATSAKELAQVCRDLAGHLEGFVWQLTTEVVLLVGASAGLLMALATLPDTLGASIVAVAPAAIVLLGSLISLAGTIGNDLIRTSDLADDAAVSIQAWPNSRFGGRTR